MCVDCGCTSGAERHLHDDARGTPYEHDHAPALEHGDAAADRSAVRILRVEQDLLGKNNAIARRNRGFLAGRRVLALNLVSSPGSGKTTLLVRTIERLRGRLPVVVIEGDQQTTRDADRIKALGVPALQINTGKGCHLDALGVAQALTDLEVPEGAILFIENVGNLVCPADFDLGERCKVLILSVTEGEDKPLKYPAMFAHAGLLLLNKTDLLPHVDFSVDLCIQYARRINSAIRVIPLSARSGDGLDEWMDWLLRASLAISAGPPES